MALAFLLGSGGYLLMEEVIERVQGGGQGKTARR
jgi:hypothetical protein